MIIPLLSEIRIFGFDFPPRGWALCNGQILSIKQNQSLYSLLGTMYGGDGRTTFALPDLRGRTPIHAGSLSGGSSYWQGQTGGTETITLTTAQIPIHKHGVIATDKEASGSDRLPTDHLPASGKGIDQSWPW